MCKSSSNLFGAGAAVFLESMCFRLAFGSSASASQACGSKFSTLSLRVTGIGMGSSLWLPEKIVVQLLLLLLRCCCVPLLPVLTYLRCLCV